MLRSLRDHSRARIALCLFFCRLAVFIIFLAWTQIKITRPEDSITLAQSFFLMPELSTTFMVAFGVFELAILVLFVLGLFKPITRVFFLFLSIVAVSVPEVLAGYITAITTVAHPTILYFTGFCLLACSFAVFYLRDHDTLFSLANTDREKWKINSKVYEAVLDDALKKKAALFLFFCRLGVFTVFFVWTYNKLVRPEHGVNIVARHYLVPGVSETLIFLFGVFEMVLCFVLVFGYWKRFSRGFFLFISVLSVMTPRVLNGYRISIFENTLPQTMLFSGFSMLACAFAIYYLRDLDTRFSMLPADKNARLP